MITGAQVRMARAALKWAVRDLADRAQVSPTTVMAVEAEKDVRAATRSVIQRALEEAGVIFIESNGDGPGVRLRKPSQ
jgi:transcriptional regulator with XRE-family HTH domain